MTNVLTSLIKVGKFIVVHWVPQNWVTEWSVTKVTKYQQTWSVWGTLYAVSNIWVIIFINYDKYV